MSIIIPLKTDKISRVTKQVYIKHGVHRLLKQIRRGTTPKAHYRKYHISPPLKFMFRHYVSVIDTI